MTSGPDLSKIKVVGRDLPDVAECHGHRTPTSLGPEFDAASRCPQCDARHHHQWVRCLVVQGDYIDIANRCLVCGGRQCDMACLERRHHRGPHKAPNGTLRQVGK